MSTDFLILTIASLICGVVFSLMITSYLSKHGIKINYLLIRLYLPKKPLNKPSIEFSSKGLDRETSLLEGYAEVYSINYLFLRATIHDFGHTTPSSYVTRGAPDTN